MLLLFIFIYNYNDSDTLQTQEGTDVGRVNENNTSVTGVQFAKLVRRHWAEIPALGSIESYIMIPPRAIQDGIAPIVDNHTSNFYFVDILSLLSISLQ